MMKTKIYKIPFMLLITFSIIIGCSKEFLEVDPRGRISQDEYYETDEQALSAIVAAYDILQSMYAADWNSAWMVKTLVSDEIVAGGSNPADQPPYQQLAKFEFTPSNPPVAATYQSCYFGIYRANKVLERVEDDSPAKKIIRAEALCLRAFYYFELVTLFGNVPLVLEELEPGNYSQPAVEASVIWEQIETDLEDAIQDLPLRSELIAQYGAQHAFRVTKGTAQAILGKALLFQQKYALAAAQFDNIITSTEYSLEPDFSRILRHDTEFGAESLFEISYSTEEGHTWANSTFPWGNGRRQENNIHWQLCGPRGDGYFDGGNTGLIAGWGFAYPTETMYEAFAEEDSIRRKYSVMSEEELIAEGGKIRNSDGELPYDCQGYIRLKYGTWEDETNVETQAELNYGTNYRLIRYADVLLMAAEAFHKSENDGRALLELNKLRDRAGLEDISVTGEALFEAIIYERRIELAFEGHRFLDLVRWNMANDVLGNKGFQNKHVLFPIPQTELDINPEMEQNPLWLGS